MFLQLGDYLLRIKALLDTSEEGAIELSDILLLSNRYRVAIFINYRLKNFRGVRILLI